MFLTEATRENNDEQTSIDNYFVCLRKRHSSRVLRFIVFRLWFFCQSTSATKFKSKRFNIRSRIIVYFFTFVRRDHELPISFDYILLTSFISLLHSEPLNVERAGENFQRRRLFSGWFVVSRSSVLFNAMMFPGKSFRSANDSIRDSDSIELITEWRRRKLFAHLFNCVKKIKFRNGRNDVDIE